MVASTSLQASHSPIEDPLAAGKCGGGSLLQSYTAQQLELIAVLGEEGMAYFRKLRDFESRFDTMSVDELKQWKIYWTQHAQGLAPKVRKLAMKRVYEIENAIQTRSQANSDGDSSQQPWSSHAASFPSTCGHSRSQIAITSKSKFK